MSMDTKLWAERARELAAILEGVAPVVEEGGDNSQEWQARIEAAWTAWYGAPEARAVRIAWMQGLHFADLVLDGLWAYQQARDRVPGWRQHQRAYERLMASEEAGRMAELVSSTRGDLGRKPTVGDKTAMARDLAGTYSETAKGALSDEQVARALDLWRPKGGRNAALKWEALAELFGAAGLGYLTGGSLANEWKRRSR